MDRWYLVALSLLSQPSHCATLRKSGITYLDHFLPDWLYKAMCTYDWTMVQIALVGFEADGTFSTHAPKVHPNQREGTSFEAARFSGGPQEPPNKKGRKHGKRNPETFKWGCVSFVQQGSVSKPRLECRCFSKVYLGHCWLPRFTWFVYDRRSPDLCPQSGLSAPVPLPWFVFASLRYQPHCSRVTCQQRPRLLEA
jgi:hypothetical protein